MFNLEFNHGTRGWHDKDESSGERWALLSKIEVSRIVDFCHFTKKFPTSPMHILLNFDHMNMFLDILERS